MGKYSNHSIYKNKDGIEVPSVTTIVKLLNKPALQKWANYLGFKRQKVDDVLNEKAELGTMFHEAVECCLMGYYYIPIAEEYMINTMKVYLGHFLDFKRQHIIEPEFMEKHMTSTNFGGTCDFYGNYDGKKTIIDFKTSKQPYSSMFLQLAAYVIMIEDMGKEVEQVMILCCNTKVTTKILSRKELNPYIETFRLLADLFNKWYDLNIIDGWGNIF